MKFTSVTSLFLALASQVTAYHPGFDGLPPPLDFDEAIAELGGDVNGSKLGRRYDIRLGYFDQLIDHSNPSLGTFKQRYWWDTTFYQGPGSPVSMFSMGESTAEPYLAYLTNRSMVGMIAQAVGGATIMLEHRYWGESSPFSDLTVHNLQYHTLNNAIADHTYFARNVKLPFDPEGKSAPSKAPWVMTGGSYAGALSAWIERLDPGTFWAYYASSPVVEAVGDFWRYFSPVQEGMPRNCSADVRKVIEHVDKVLLTGSPQEKLAIKTKFGFADLEHDSDFGSAIANAIKWQPVGFSSGYSSFFRWCDYVENALPSVFPGASTPTAEGVGLEKALEGYAKYTRDIMIPGSCDPAIYGANNPVACYNTFNLTDPSFTDLSLSAPINRAWWWMTCNEPFKWWQGGAPQGEPTIVSRLVDTKYYDGYCDRMFPPEVVDGRTYRHGIARGLDVDGVNRFTDGGWLYTNSTRLLQVNNEFDPWRDATVSSVHRPGGPLESTDERPVLLVVGGGHCSDLVRRESEANADLEKQQIQAVAIMKKWVLEFPGKKA
ncbi:hypothetical protein RB601_005461 [Gaeumannomyces tritici]